VSLSQWRDADVRPQDNLFAHANGRFLRTAQIRPDREAAGVWYEVNDRVQHDLEDIVGSVGVGHPRCTPEQLVGEFHASFMDLPRLAAQGDDLLRELVADVVAAADIGQLSARFGLLCRHQLDSLLRFSVVADPRDPGEYILRWSQGGIGLPSREYYLAPEYAETLSAYRMHVANMLALAGQPNAQAQAERVVWLETELAKNHTTIAEARDVERAFRPLRLTQVSKLAPTINWFELLAQLDLSADGDPEMIVAQPEYLIAVAPLLVAERLDDWRAWAAWRVIEGLADYGPAPLANAHWEFTDTRLRGLDAPEPRSRRVLAYVEHFLGEAMGQLYVGRRYPKRAAERIETLIKNIVAEYASTISNAHWLTMATRGRALKKLNWLGARIGAPKVWHNYSTLDIEPDDLLGNALRASSHITETQVDKLFGLTNGEDWQIPAHVVNSYYDLSKNQIVFPAAFLQPPFFDIDADDAYNYGAIGAIIAHEISHGFDARGSRFDGEGRLVEWWLPEDREGYDEVISRFAQQLDELPVRDETNGGDCGKDADAGDRASDHAGSSAGSGSGGPRLDGKLVVNEAFADLAGLIVAYRAWRRTIAPGADEGEEIDGYTPAQRFFLAYAGIWRTVERPEERAVRLATDPHPPAEVRCNQIVRNFDPFHVAFAVKPADPMWLRPALRVNLW
jgi:putative endopeptidase